MKTHEIKEGVTLTHFLKFGADLGATTFRGAYCANHKQVIQFPNYMLEGRPTLLGSRSQPEDAIHLQVLEAPCAVPAEYAMGKLALKQGEPLDPRVSKLESEQIRAGMVALLAAAAATTEASVIGLAVGVPMMDYLREAARDQFARQFRGRYRVRFVSSSNPKWGALGELTFTVAGVTVVCEGAPALDVVGDTGDAWRAASDCGGSTWDCPVFERAPDGIYDLADAAHCGKAEIGINQAMDNLTAEANRVYGWDYSRAEYETFLGSSGDVPNGDGEPVSILKLAAPHLTPVAHDLARHLRNVWRRQTSIRTFEAMGGGHVLLSHLLPVALDELWKGSTVPFKVRLVENPRLVNVLGFWLQAQEAFGNG